MRPQGVVIPEDNPTRITRVVFSSVLLRSLETCCPHGGVDFAGAFGNPEACAGPVTAYALTDVLTQ